MPCVSDTTILAYFRGELDATATTAIEAELDTCSLCRELMLLVAAEWRANDGALGDALRPGSSVGRYEIVEPIGAGAMGVVYRARDPELARDVAIKVMARPAPEHAERLRSEAQAMARLQHRNVIPVFDVGAAGNQTYVAMGLIRGATLREWLAKEAREKGDVLDRFAQAADGLAAAHDAGVVHRDFKPDNVMVGHDGTVMVGDFGLALAGEMAAGTPAGTPAYVAPEVVNAGSSGPAADQYSFFVALHEALTGERPKSAFAGGTPRAVANGTHALKGDTNEVASSLNAGGDANAKAASDANARPAPTIASIRPRRLAKAIERGLARDPKQRFASMTEVARELRAIEKAPQRMLIAAGIVVSLIGAVVLTVLVLRMRGAAGEACANAGSEIAAVWSQAKASELRAAFAKIDKPYAQSAADAASRMLGAYAQTWRNSAEAACRATHVDGTQSADLLDRRVACLAGRRADLEAVIARLSEASGDIALRAVDMVKKLAPTAFCDDIVTLKDEPLPPADPAIVRAIADVRGQIAKVKAHFAAGTFEAGVPIAQQAVDAARATGFKPILAEALQSLGNILISAGKPKDALPILEEGLLAAEASRHTYVSIGIRILQAELLGVTLGKYDEARKVVVLGRATAEGIGAKRLAAELDMQLGIVDSELGKHGEALELYKRALQVFVATDGEQSSDAAHVIGLIGIELDDLGKHDEAIAHLEKALRLTGEVYGAAHPNVANAMSNLASHLYLGDAAAKQRGLELGQKAHAIRVAALPADHKELAMSWSNVGAMLKMSGDLAGAHEHLKKALEIKQRTLGDKHPSTGVTHLTVAEVLFARKDAKGSLEHSEKAVAIFAAALGETHRYTATARAHLGVTLVELKRNDDAIEAFEAAVPHLQGTPDQHRHRFNLAQLLIEGNKDVARGKKLLDEAEAGAKAVGDQPALDAIGRFRKKLPR